MTSNAIAHIGRHFITDGGLVYDIGASTGNIGKCLGETLAERNGRLIAIEPSPDMARLYEGGGILVEQRVQDITFQPYDFAVSHLALCFLNREDREEVLKNVLSARKRGGAFVMLEKTETCKGYAASVMLRLVLAEKLRMGASPDEIIDKELSLAGQQIPFAQWEIPDGSVEWFRYGDFAGYLFTD